MSIEQLILKWEPGGGAGDEDDPRAAASALAAALKSLVTCRRPRADGRTCHSSARFGQFCAGCRAMAELDKHLVSEGEAGGAAAPPPRRKLPPGHNSCGCKSDVCCPHQDDRADLCPTCRRIPEWCDCPKKGKVRASGAVGA